MATTFKAGDEIQVKHWGDEAWQFAEIESVAADVMRMQIALLPGCKLRYKEAFMGWRLTSPPTERERPLVCDRQQR